MTMKFLAPEKLSVAMIKGLLEHVRVIEHRGEIFYARYGCDVDADGEPLVAVYCWDEECGWNVIEKDDVPIVVLEQLNPRTKRERNMNDETEGQFAKRAIEVMASRSFNAVVLLFNEAILKFNMDHPVVLALVVNMNQRCLAMAPGMSTGEGVYKTLDAFKVYEAVSKLSA